MWAGLTPFEVMQCTPKCKGEMPCIGDVPPEFLEEDSPALEGDVANSLAMINHKLLKAARDGHVENIRKVLDRGAYIETRRPFVMAPESVTAADSALMTRSVGLTPLMYAAQGGYVEACQVLLKAGACVNSEDEDGMRPLHFAATSGCPETCQTLLHGGADPAARDDEGRTALAHVPSGDAITLSEKKYWRDLLGDFEDAVENDLCLGAPVMAPQRSNSKPKPVELDCEVYCHRPGNNVELL